MADSEALRDQLSAAEAALVDALDAMELSNRGDRQPMSEIADAHSVVQRWRLVLEAERWSGRSGSPDPTTPADRDSESTS